MGPTDATTATGPTSDLAPPAGGGAAGAVATGPASDDVATRDAAGAGAVGATDADAASPADVEDGATSGAEKSVQTRLLGVVVSVIGLAALFA